MATIEIVGTNVPGLTAGSFYHHEGWVFWDVRNPARAIGIDLHDERFRKLVVEVDDPANTIATIAAAISSRGLPAG